MVFSVVWKSNIDIEPQFVHIPSWTLLGCFKEWTNDILVSDQIRDLLEPLVDNKWDQLTGLMDSNSLMNSVVAKILSDTDLESFKWETGRAYSVKKSNKWTEVYYTWSRGSGSIITL